MFHTVPRSRRVSGVLGVLGVEAGVAVPEREADGDQSVDGERHEDPDGRVAARVERELLQLAQTLIQLLHATMQSTVINQLSFHRDE